MKVVGLVSGGKDSCYNLMEVARYGHEVTVLANLHPPVTKSDELDSFMFQTVGHSAVETLASCMELPLVRRPITGGSVSQGMMYKRAEEDEVEDLYHLLLDVKTQFPEVNAVATGAIFSNYQRHRVENICKRLNLTSLAYLWRRDQKLLLSEMVNSNVEAILIKTAAMGLKPRQHLGKTIKQLEPLFNKLHNEFEFNVCGEGGEYETFTLDCPLFRRRISVGSTPLVMHDDCAFSAVGYLRLLDAEAVPKEHTEDTFSVARLDPTVTSLLTAALSLPLSIPSRLVGVASTDATVAEDLCTKVASVSDISLGLEWPSGRSGAASVPPAHAHGTLVSVSAVVAPCLAAEGANANGSGKPGMETALTLKSEVHAFFLCLLM